VNGNGQEEPRAESRPWADDEPQRYRTGWRRALFGLNGSKWRAAAHAVAVAVACALSVAALGRAARVVDLTRWTAQHRRDVTGKDGLIQLLYDTRAENRERWAQADEWRKVRDEDINEIKGQLSTLNKTLFLLLTDAEQRAVLRQGFHPPETER